jgi:chromosome segregation ATPase
MEERKMSTTPADTHVEARIARLESDMGHARVDLSDVKSDVRVLRDKIDVLGEKLAERSDSLGDKLEIRIESVNTNLGKRIDDLSTTLGKRIDDVSTNLGKRIDDASTNLGKRIDDLGTKVDGVKDSLAAARVWALFLYITLAAGMLTTIARGFQWI